MLEEVVAEMENVCLCQCITSFQSLAPTHRLHCSLWARSTLHQLSHTWVGFNHQEATSSFDDLMIIMLDAMVSNYTPLCAPVVSQGSGDVTSFLMTEARQHNTEIRLAVGKVGDKVDQLASKVHSEMVQNHEAALMQSRNIWFRFFSSFLKILTDRWSSKAGGPFHGFVYCVDGNLHDLAQYPKNCSGTCISSAVLYRSIVKSPHLQLFWALILLSGKWVFKKRSVWEKFSHRGAKP